MKKGIVLTLVLSVIFSISSCTGLLDEDSRTQVTDDYLNTVSGFNDVVNAAYSYSRVYTRNENYMHMTEFGVDTWSNGFDGGSKYLNFYNNNLNSRAGKFDALWNELYLAINTANTAISRADEVTGIDEDLKNIRVSEAKFLRAQWYFLLVQWFGPIHLTLDETQGVQTEASRAPVADVYEVIISDLNDAIQSLPDIASEYGRATKPAAEHLLAKVYLTRASTEATQSSDYQNAAQLAKNVIYNYNFKLLDDYGQIFEQGKDAERHEEVVWAVQNGTDFLTNGGSGDGNGNTLHTYYLMKYDDLPGLTRDIENGRPWARFRPTNFVKTTLFDKEHDSRYDKIWKRVFYTNTPGTYTSVNGHQMTLSMGDTALYIVDEEWDADRIANAGYSVYTLSEHTDRVYPTLNKFLDPQRPSVPEMSGSRDFFVMRLGETYLIAAEALMMMGNTAEAATYVNAVRTRAAIEGSEQAMQISPSQLDIDFILDERARELLGEGWRWFDLVRTKKLLERVRMYNPDAVGIKDHHVLRPIPQNQIDRTDGGESAFPQNPGY